MPKAVLNIASFSIFHNNSRKENILLLAFVNEEIETHKLTGSSGGHTKVR